jgi:hypothetical protein
MVVSKYLLAAVLVIWPFHHKETPKPPPLYEYVPIPEEPLVMDSDCIRVEDYFAFPGPDGIFGLSTISCDAAARDWVRGTHVFPRLSRV